MELGWRGWAGLGWAGLPIININNLICQPRLVIAADRKWAAAGQLPRSRARDKWLDPAASLNNTLPNLRTHFTLYNTCMEEVKLIWSLLSYTGNWRFIVINKGINDLQTCW